MFGSGVAQFCDRDFPEKSVRLFLDTFVFDELRFEEFRGRNVVLIRARSIRIPIFSNGLTVGAMTSISSKLV
jgi:hypothetical protein